MDLFSRPDLVVELDAPINDCMGQRPKPVKRPPDDDDSDSDSDRGGGDTYSAERPIKVSQFYCTVNCRHTRRDGNDRDEEGMPKRCPDCGARMFSHFYMKKP